MENTHALLLLLLASLASSSVLRNETSQQPPTEAAEQPPTEAALLKTAPSGVIGRMHDADLNDTEELPPAKLMERAAAFADLPGKPLKFFLTTKLVTLTEAMTVTSTITTHNTCFKTQAGIEPCSRRRRSYHVEVSPSEGTNLFEVEIVPTKVEVEERSGNADDSEDDFQKVDFLPTESKDSGNSSNANETAEVQKVDDLPLVTKDRSSDTPGQNETADSVVLGIEQDLSPSIDEFSVEVLVEPYQNQTREASNETENAAAALLNSESKNSSEIESAIVKQDVAVEPVNATNNNTEEKSKEIDEPANNTSPIVDIIPDSAPKETNEEVADTAEQNIYPLKVEAPPEEHEVNEEVIQAKPAEQEGEVAQVKTNETTANPPVVAAPDSVQNDTFQAVKLDDFRVTPNEPDVVSAPEIQEGPIVDLSQESKQANNEINLDSSLNGAGDDNWVEREIIGINSKCFDPSKVAHRFLTLVETTVLWKTLTSTAFVAAPELQTVSFASSNACLPTNIDQLFTIQCK